MQGYWAYIRNVSSQSYCLRMKIGVIVYMAELEAPALRQTARRILEAEAARFGVPPGPGQSRGGSPVHVMAAGHALVRHLAATVADPLGEDSPLMVLARAGTLTLVSRVETVETATAL
jgi:hypothetical protein